MKYTTLQVAAFPPANKDKKAADSDDGYGITEDQKQEFFKLYPVFSKKVRKFVGRKKDSKLIKECFKNLLNAMRTLSEL